ncbi:equilibrative nucleotide transporter 1-like [Chenopodium quinoa]|uniref:Equilibrative nucleotide transporter 1 n=1 Tax=Chenopodium quinoa TaxID=63459 RepID=A0A803L0I1_CHEQI|nr:equilibrative nucleotide transporter 1-like [Chenopodium quinoa]
MEAKEEATVSLLHHTTPTNNGDDVITNHDSFNLAYIIYLILGTGMLLPWNAFITAVDYFNYLYPDRSIDRIFAVVYQSVSLLCLLLIVFCFRKFHAYVRINIGLGLFLIALLVVPLMDWFYIRGQSGLYDGFYVTIGVVGLSGVANALVQGSIIGSAAELPERYMQAVVSGTSASGVLVSLMRIFTKAVYPQGSNDGLRNSAILYFIVAILFMVICFILFNVVSRLPVIKHHNSKLRNEPELIQEELPLSASIWETIQKIRWYGFGITLVYIVALSIFPGSVTEDVHSTALGDWYAILLITCYNVFDLIGKSLTAVYLLKNANIALGASFTRLLFYPLYLGCLHGPQFFRTEIPVISLTSLLGFTTGYFASVLMILTPKMVQLQHSETAGILVVVFLILGLAIGSIFSWFWVI